MAYNLLITQQFISKKNLAFKRNLHLLAHFCKTLFFVGFLTLTTSCIAGITGTLSGTVIDKDAGTVLPGAAILVKGTTIGTMADKNGRYIIYNLPAGSYDVSISMIGYSKLTIKNVTINVDLITSLDFRLSAKVLPLNEVVITDNKKLIQSDITSSAYFISGEEINEQLPIDSYREAIALLPGVSGDHIRGGRETAVLYLLDGLPVQSGLSRQIASYFPNSTIAEMMVQTGGFSSEYGNATSGIVNIISKDGRNKVKGNLRFYSDSVESPIADTDNTRRVDFSLGGPLTIGLGGPLIKANYFIAADLNMSDASHRRELRSAFDAPIFTNYNINSKLSFDIARNTILTLHGLISNWNWHQLEPQWELNPAGVAENKHYSHRLSASLTHTFSPKFFASVRYGFYSTKRLILGNTENNPPQLVFQDAKDATSPILLGDQPRDEQLREKVHITKFNIVGQLAKHHIIKTGVEFQKYMLQNQSVIFESLTKKGPTNELNSIVFNQINDNYSQSPGFYSFYIQDQITLKGVNANIGLRYDALAPNIKIDSVSSEFRQLQTRLRAPVRNSKSEKHTPVSPRLGLSLPLSDKERIHVNYGWYYQMPPLYYYYTNSTQAPDTYLPLIGNTELEPTKTISTEFSYKRIIADEFLLVFTGFTKRFENLIDTRLFILPDSLLDGTESNIGYTQYVNQGSAKASGFEVTMQKRITSALSARLSYTYMKARGNSSMAEAGHKRALAGRPLRQGTRFPLSWDQRHSLILNADYQSAKMSINLLYRILSPLPATTELSQIPNDTRADWRHLIDFRIYLKNAQRWNSHIRPFLEIRNLLDQNNIAGQENVSQGVSAYRLFDPINSNRGRRLRLGVVFDF